ncbi:MAG: hypothetical protein EOM37_12710 [Proteobacteria bacterium]|nr:hypothetical protein [Pseudomonadota bacterium]
MPTEIYCPFCNTLIVESTDISELYDEDGNFIRDEFYDDDEDENRDEDFDEEEEKSERLCDYTDGECPHLAFWSDWAYAGSRIESDWATEMIALSCFLELCYDSKDMITDQLILDLKQEVDAQIANYEDLTPLEKDEISHRIAEYLNGSEDYVAELIPFVFPSREVKFEVAFVCKGDGVRGNGGKIFMCIFMKEADEINAN